ncbi:helix-turn-helix domain-containing protein [Metabacillus malikii]|uniref:Helix-turn-helix domain-containing protein n=1 Tax=Metabacillus malikii TaxID=1504265 RepID=A0ABT9ZL59_9BACI|nr:helix-turn-helix domain-containing protein [Metabacillus malikii]MDQ0233023.1 hypothetical protein [Metabacillus malikii]
MSFLWRSLLLLQERVYMALGTLRNYYYEEMKEYSQFESLEQFNEYTKKLRYFYMDKLNATDFTLIDYLAKHAVKAAKGVACPKVGTIAKAIERSIDTVGRIVRKLEGLGIIKRAYNMRTKKGGNGANFYVFLKDAIPTDTEAHTGANIQGRNNWENIGSPKNEDASSSDKTNIARKLDKNNNKIIEKTTVHNSETHQQLVDCEVYSDIPNLIRASLKRLGNNKLANNIWRKIIQAYVRSSLYEHFNKLSTLQDLLNASSDFLRTLYTKVHNAIYGYAHGEIQDIYGYIYRVVTDIFEEQRAELDAVIRRVAKHPSYLYNWLEE